MFNLKTLVLENRTLVIHYENVLYILTADCQNKIISPEAFFTRKAIFHYLIQINSLHIGLMTLTKCSHKDCLNEASTIEDKNHTASSSFPAQGLIQFSSDIFVLKLVS